MELLCDRTNEAPGCIEWTRIGAPDPSALWTAIVPALDEERSRLFTAAGIHVPSTNSFNGVLGAIDGTTGGTVWQRPTTWTEAVGVLYHDDVLVTHGTNGSNEMIRGRDAGNGAIRWTATFGPVADPIHKPKVGPAGRSLILSPDGLVAYAMAIQTGFTDHLFFTAIRVADGSVLWRIDLPAQSASGKTMAVTPDGSTLVAAVTRWFGGGGFDQVIGIDAATGSLRWRAQDDDDGGGGFETRIFIEPNGQRAHMVYAGWDSAGGGARIVTLDPRDGSVLGAHRYQRDPMRDDLPLPTVPGALGPAGGFAQLLGSAISPSGDRIYLTGVDKGIGCACDAERNAAIVAIDTATSEVAWYSTWTQTPEAWAVPSLISVAANGEITVAMLRVERDGTIPLVAIDPMNGVPLATTYVSSADGNPRGLLQTRDGSSVFVTTLRDPPSGTGPGAAARIRGFALPRLGE